MVSRFKRHPGGVRRGFSMMEILVALGIMAVLTAVLVPALSSKARDGRTAAIAQTLQGLAQGIAEYKKATTRYPSTLQLLTTAPVAGSLDACGNSTTTFILWRGPYVSREMLSTGTPMGDGQILNALTRVTSGTQAFLQIKVTGVETKTADDLETLLDGTTTSPATTGTLRQAAGGPGVADISYTFPINGC